MSVIGTLDKYANTNNLIINELTTIASAYCFHNFINMYGDLKGLKVASLMFYNLVKLNGQLSDVITSSPNGNETNSMALLNTFSNIISLTINDPKMYEILVLYTLNPSIVTNTFDLIGSIIENSYYNIKKIFTTSFVNTIYEPYLDSTKTITSFTIAVKVNATGNNDYLFGGPDNLVFDDEGNAWITNNVLQGTPNSSNFSVVLQPDGKPHSISPIVNSAIIGQGSGVIKYFGKVKNHIPRSEITQIREFIYDVFTDLDPNLVFDICGSFRRKKPFSNDIDLLVTSYELVEDNQEKATKIMKKIINSLEDKKFIIDRLTDESSSTKFMGLCKKFKDIRRLDIRLVPMKSFFPAYLYFTGSYEFNEKMRGIAKRQGFKLNEYGLYKGEKLIQIYCEKDVFDILGMNYLEPKDRL
jgi:hypothetical protein